MQSEAVMDENETPVIEMSGGNPTDDEIAAIAAVLKVIRVNGVVAEETDDRPLAGGWSTYLRAMRRTPPPGREAWKYSARP